LALHLVEATQRRIFEPNKTDKNDALGVAQLVRSGWYRDVRVKSEASYRLRLLLTHRRALKHKFLDLENEIRHSLKVFRVKLSAVGRVGFEARVRELIGGDALLLARCRRLCRADAQAHPVGRQHRL
jgi:transposase